MKFELSDDFFGLFGTTQFYIFVIYLLCFFGVRRRVICEYSGVSMNFVLNELIIIASGVSGCSPYNRL